VSIADQAQRQQALDIEHSFIVQAPAGSGKTGVLTLRILKLLTVVETPEQILAITFTKKAAAEMRVRVMEALELAQREQPPSNPYDQQFYTLGKQVIERDNEKGWGLKQNQSRLKLLTIDSFCNGIVKNRPMASGLGVQFSITEDASELYTEATRELLKSMDDDDELGAALRRVLRQLDNNYNKLNGLVSQMLAQRDHWLQDVSQLHGNLPQFKALLEHSLVNLNQNAFDDLQQQFNPDFPQELDAIALYAENQLYTTKPSHPLLQASKDSFECAKQKFNLLLTAKMTPRARLDKNGGFPSGESAAEKKEAKEYKERAKSLIAQIERAGQPGLDAIKSFLTLPAENISDDQWRLLADLLLIIRYAAAHLKLIFQHQRNMDFSEVALAALETLGTSDNPSDLTLMLDNSINHILVDEFQDTSFVQVELLERLTAGWAINDGRSLFLVGDPMQSIYAFRKADVGLFLRLWQQQSLGSVELKPLQLNTNFRSSESVIQWINLVFSAAFPGKADIRKGAVTYADSHAAKPAESTDQVSVELFCHQPEDKPCANQAEALWIAEQIKNCEPHYSIAVLVKGKNHVIDIALSLRQAQIAYQAVDIESLAQSQLITDLMSVARAFSSPNDKVAWFALLRGPWCGISLTQLQQLTCIHPVPWLALCQLPDDSDVRLQHLHAVFERAYANRHRGNWADGLRSLVLELGIPAAATCAADLESIDLFFDLVQRVDPIADVPNFEQLDSKLKDLFVPPDIHASGQRVIQIMTMHKSKGLEFDVVFLPQLNRKPRADDKPLILVDKQTSLTSADQELFIAPIDSALPNTSTTNTSIYQYLWQLQKDRLNNEAARLLYVASTRAKRQLYLSAAIELKEDELKNPDGNSLLSLIWPFKDKLFSATQHSVESTEQVQQSRYFHSASPEFIKLISQQQPITQAITQAESNINTHGLDSGFDPSDGNIDQYRRHAGTLVHRVFEQFVRNPSLFQQLDVKSNIPLWLQELSRLGVVSSQQRSAIAIVERAILACLKSQTGNWLFGQSHYQQNEAELAITHQLGDQTIRNLIIDRTFIDNGTRYIIDYKLSEPSADQASFLQHEAANYRHQLAAYKAALNEVEMLPTKTYLYFPLIDCLHEVVV
jgi:ATP-dependent helicase/nuclease subunit A